MKKIVLGMAASAMLTGVLMAQPADRTIGVNYLNVDGTTEYGLSYGINKLWNPIDSVSGFGLGGGFNTNLNTLSEDISSASAGYTYGLDGELLVGYNFSSEGVPMYVKAGAGYDFEVVSSEVYMSGMLYTASVGYDFSKTYGMELLYRGGSMQIETPFSSSDSFDRTSYTLNFVWRR